MNEAVSDAQLFSSGFFLFDCYTIAYAVATLENDKMNIFFRKRDKTMN